MAGQSEACAIPAVLQNSGRRHVCPKRELWPVQWPAQHWLGLVPVGGEYKETARWAMLTGSCAVAGGAHSRCTAAGVGWDMWALHAAVQWWSRSSGITFHQAIRQTELGSFGVGVVCSVSSSCLLEVACVRV